MSLKWSYDGEFHTTTRGNYIALVYYRNDHKHHHLKVYWKSTLRKHSVYPSAADAKTAAENAITELGKSRNFPL